MNKKILAVLMALMMVLTSVAAFAETGIYTSTEFLTLHKEYELNGAAPSDLPEEALTFTAEYVEVANGEVGAGEASAPVVTVDTKPAGEYTWENAINVELPAAPKTGVYKYEIKENVGTEAGVTYDTSSFYVYVLVGPNADGTGYEIKTIYVNDGTKKIDEYTFTNLIDKLGSVKITKTITGSLANTSDVFAVDVTITLPQDVTVTANNMTISANDSITGQATAVAPFVNGVSTTTIQVTNGTEITINNIPAGAVVNVAEQEAGLTIDGITYDDTYTGNNATVVKGETKTVAITNTANVDNIPTGVFTDNMPYFMLMAFVMILAAAVVLKKRTVNE